MAQHQLREFGRLIELNGSPALADPESGYVFFDPPSDADLAHFYATQYGRENPEYYSLRANYDPERVGGSMRFIREVLTGAGAPWGGGQRVHELGCAFGGIVAALNAEGFRATGSDLNTKAIAAGSTLKRNRALRAGAHIDALADIEPCDVILASHTLEHDPHLSDTLLAIRRALKPGGVLFAAVPNVMFAGAVLEGFQRHPWAAYPDHLHMLSMGCMARLCDAADLDPLMVWTHDLGAFGQGAPNRAALEKLLCLNGQGMELMFVLTPAGRSDVAERVRTTRGDIEAARLREIAMRRWLAEAEPGPTP